MSRNTLLALWGATTLLGYLITFFFNFSQAGTRASAEAPDPVPVTEQAAPVNDAAAGTRAPAGEAVTKSETLSVDTQFPTGEDDTLATDTAAVGTVLPSPAYSDSVLTSTVSGGTGGPDTTLANASDADTDPATTATADPPPLATDADPAGAPDAVATPVAPRVLQGIVFMWIVLMAVPIALGIALSAMRGREHLTLSLVWSVLIAGALLQNLWALGASASVQAFSFYPLWFFVAALGFGITAAKLDLGAQTRLYAAAAGANLLVGVALIVMPGLAAAAYLLAAALQGVPILLDPVVTARAKRAAAS